MPTLQELEAAAVDIIDILKSIPEFQDATILVIGGLALWKYIPTGRTTEDVDFSVSVRGAPQSVKQKLLALPGAHFVQRAQLFFYVNPNGAQIQVDMVPFDYSPYVPSAATKIKDVPSNSIPYISVVDLICFKMNSCGLRAEAKKRRTDAADAETLLIRAAADSPLELAASQKEIIEHCIEDVVKYGEKSESWWRQHLGLPTQ